MDMVQGLMMEQSLPQCCEEDREDASNGWCCDKTMLIKSKEIQPGERLEMKLNVNALANSFSHNLVFC